MGSGASTCRNDPNMLIHKNIDPEGDFGVPAPAVEAPAPPPADAALEPAELPPAPPPADAALEPAVLPPAPIHCAGIVLAQVNRIDEEEGLKDAKVHEGVKDVKVGGEVLVMNPTLTIITPDQLEAREEVDVTSDEDNILQQISSTSGMGTNYTATIASFVVPPQPANTVIPPTAPIDIPTPERLVEPALEATKPQTPARVLEKGGESVAEPAQKRQAVEKDPESTLNQAGPSSSNSSL